VEAIQQEVTREVEHLLQLIFRQRGNQGGLDLEAVEMAIRSAMHQAGVAALSELLQFDPPGAEQRRLPCSCGSAAHYLEVRSKPVLTAVGWVELRRPYFTYAPTAIRDNSRPIESWMWKAQSFPRVCGAC
jgi:hypothetical protein